jgi:hypothetical protein
MKYLLVLPVMFLLVACDPTPKEIYESCIIRGGTMAEFTYFHNVMRNSEKKTELYCAYEFKKVGHNKE